MKTPAVKMKLIMFVSLCILLSNAFGQSKEDLQGKWKLERISAVENHKQIAIGLDGFDFEIPSEIDIQQGELIFARKSYTDKAKYNTVIRGNMFCFSVCATWKIAEGKLQLEWDRDIEGPSGDPEMQTVTLIYGRK